MKINNKILLTMIVALSMVLLISQNAFAAPTDWYSPTYIVDHILTSAGLASGSPYSLGALIFSFVLPLIIFFVFLDMIMSFTFDHFSPFKQYTKHKTILAVLFTLCTIPLGLFNIVVTYMMGLGTMLIVGVFIFSIALFWFWGRHGHRSLAKKLLKSGTEGVEINTMVRHDKALIDRRVELEQSRRMVAIDVEAIEKDIKDLKTKIYSEGGTATDAQLKDLEKKNAKLMEKKQEADSLLYAEKGSQEALAKQKKEDARKLEQIGS